MPKGLLQEGHPALGEEVSQGEELLLELLGLGEPSFPEVVQKGPVGPGGEVRRGQNPPSAPRARAPRKVGAWPV